MLIKENQLKDVFEINSIPKTDNRGSFSRFFCKKTLSELSKNITKGTTYLSCWMTKDQIKKLKTKKVMFKEFE